MVAGKGMTKEPQKGELNVRLSLPMKGYLKRPAQRTCAKDLRKGPAHTSASLDQLKMDQNEKTERLTVDSL